MSRVLKVIEFVLLIELRAARRFRFAKVVRKQDITLLGFARHTYHHTMPFSSSHHAQHLSRLQVND